MRLERRRVLRLRLRDLAAASAFSAVALSGSLPAPVPVLFIAALVLSLAGRRPFARKPIWSVVALLFTALVLFGLAFRGVIDLVIAAVSFACLVTGQRMLSEPEPSTDQQVLLASLLLMAGAAALSGEVWYALCLLAFGVFACLSLGLTVIEGPVERDEELPLSPVTRQVGWGVTLSLIGGIAFFVLFPRLSWNVAARRSGPGLLGGTTGMTDRVRLGGGGDIKTSARVVLRATLEPSPTSDRLDRYWVGRHFDAFDGREWRGTGKPASPRPRVMLGDLSRATIQRIELLPAYDSRTLVGLEHPVAFSQAAAIGTAGSVPVQLVKVDSEEVRFAEDANTYTYVAHSSDTPALESEDAVLESLKVLPGKLDPRVAALAKQIAGSSTEPLQIAQKLERWLNSNLSYTLELPGEVDDPLTDFLFVRKAGHCEHFATALAVMLRTQGISTRVVGGFFGGERLGERYVVRAGDAHAWVEAYIPGKGWLTFDATPDDGRGGQPQALIARLVDAYERLEELWRSKVVDYSLLDQWNFVRRLIRPPADAAAQDDRSEDPSKRSSGKIPLRSVVMAVVAGLLTWVLWNRLTRRRQEHPAATFLAQVESRLTSARVSYLPGEDLESLPVRLRHQGHPLAAAVDRARRRYLEARFGGRPLTSPERRQILDALRLPNRA